MDVVVYIRDLCFSEPVLVFRRSGLRGPLLLSCPDSPDRADRAGPERPGAKHTGETLIDRTGIGGSPGRCTDTVHSSTD